MSGFANPIVGGGGKLVFPSIHSPGYVPGTSGWTINKDGSAEFSDGTFRGIVTASTFEGVDYEINAAGAFFYSGAPAAGNLIISISKSNGTDPYGNVYQAGVGVYSSSPDLLAVLAAGGLLLSALTGAAGQGMLNYVTGSPGFGLATAGAGLSAEYAAAAPLRACLDLLGSDGAHPGQLNLYGDNGSDVTEADMNIAGVIRRVLTGPAPAVESWHDFSLAAGWSVGTDSNGTSYPPAYQLLPDGAVALRGCLVTPSSGTVTGVPFNATPLAAPYVPASGSNIPTAGVIQASGAHAGTVEIHPNGNAELQGNWTNGDNARLDCTVRIS